mgnify:CR=1 FL=1
MTDIENKDLFENNENTTPETESADLGEENVVKDNADEMSVVSAKDSALDQTVSAVSSDAAIFERNVTDFNVEKERRKQKVGNVLKNVLVYTVLTVCAVLAFLPFYWMVISSLKTEMEYRQSVPTFFPHTFMWKNYEAVLSQTSSGGSGSFVQILINTLVVGFFSTTIGVLVTIITCSHEIQGQKHFVHAHACNDDDSGRNVHDHQLSHRVRMGLERYVYGHDTAVPRERVLYLFAQKQLYANPRFALQSGESGRFVGHGLPC